MFCLRQQAIVTEQSRFALLRQDHSDDQNIASHDFLTKLPNRHLFEEKLEYWHQKFIAESRNFSIILADLDHCKSINDHHGREVGDLALKKWDNSLAKNFAGQT